jgi:hypothetical protein
MVLWPSTSVSIPARRDKIVKIQLAKEMRANKDFYVSRDKTSNSVKMMGASKWTVELFIMHDRLIQVIAIKRS